MHRRRSARVASRVLRPSFADFREAAQLGDRRAQLVRDVGGDAPLPGEGFVNPAQQIVHPPDEGRHFARRGGRFDRPIEVFGADALDLARQLAEWRQSADHRPTGQQEQENQKDRCPCDRQPAQLGDRVGQGSPWGGDHHGGERWRSDGAGFNERALAGASRWFLVLQDLREVVELHGTPAAHRRAA